jgi:hypothetical protein
MKKYTVKKTIRLDQHACELMNKNMSKKYGDGRVTESEYIRSLIYADNIENADFDKKQFIKMRRVLAGCGNNLNQIAHKMNMDIYTQADKVKLMSCMDDVRNIRRQLDVMIKRLFEE